VGISLTDYLVVRKGNVWVEDLYTGDSNGRYWYTGGVHWRASVAYVVAVVLPIPGFATLFGHQLPGAWLKIYEIGWFLTCVVSSVVYFGLSFVGDFARDERGMRFEEVAEGQRYIDGVGDVEAVPPVVLSGEK
jgi:NCS1 family nucleobase:cation symporter-1